MIEIIWRQHRGGLAGVAALLGLLAVWLWINGTSLHNTYTTALACHPACSAVCQNLISNTFSTSASSRFMSNSGSACSALGMGTLILP